MAKLSGFSVCAMAVGIASATAGSYAQAPATGDAASTAPAAAQPTSTQSAVLPTDPTVNPPATAPIATAPAQTPISTKRMYTVPAGTKVLLQLRSGINTRSAKVGDGVYLSSSFPVVVGSRVMIPAGVYVQGVIDRVQRAGRAKGKSQLDMHFTSIIFPNGSVVEVPGLVDSLPGAKKQQVKGNGEGTIEQDPDRNRNAGEVAKIALPTGASTGTIAGAIEGHPIAGGLIGVGAGLAAVGIASLFTRGADVNIDAGSQVEMVLQRPLLLEDENLASGSAPGSSPSLVPSSNQPKPLDKPNRARVICPPGGLGCE